MDKDGDGQLTKEELYESYAKILPPAEARYQVESILDKIDYNQSDTIDFSEFLSIAIDYSSLLNEERLF